MEIEKESVPQYTLLLDQEDMTLLRRIIRICMEDKDLSPEEARWGRHFLDLTARLMR